MDNKKPKSINSLMSYMRYEKGISIQGSVQKRKLRCIGYFHGYKGYRYHGKSSSMFSVNSFNEIQAIYDFDMALKTMFYPRIMFLETSFKNYVLEVILNKSKSSSFVEIYSSLLTDYKTYSVGSDKYEKAIRKRLNLRNHIYEAISRSYGKKNIVNHFYHNDRPLPIWAIFELLSLGEFGSFLDCLNKPSRLEVSKSIGIKSSVDSDGKILSKVVYALTDLRNAVAHNGVVFDTRFASSQVNDRLQKYIEAETGIKGMTFTSIVDYVILVAFMMKCLKCPKSEIHSFISSFEQHSEAFRKSVSSSIYMSIVYSDTRNKITILKKYI